MKTRKELEMNALIYRQKIIKADDYFDPEGRKHKLKEVKDAIKMVKKEIGLEPRYRSLVDGCVIAWLLEYIRRLKNE